MVIVIVVVLVISCTVAIRNVSRILAGEVCCWSVCCVWREREGERVVREVGFLGGRAGLLLGGSGPQAQPERRASPDKQRLLDLQLVEARSS